MVLCAFKKFVVLVAAAAASVSVTTSASYLNEFGILQVGATELLNITANAGADNEYTIAYPDASYISVQFENVDLPEGDVLIVRSPDSADGYVYTGKGRGDLGELQDWRVVCGFNSALEAICGAADQMKSVKCFIESMCTKAKAIAGFFIGGTSLCMGWPGSFGSSGHLITNQHCIGNTDAAAQIDVEFGTQQGY